MTRAQLLEAARRASHDEKPVYVPPSTTLQMPAPNFDHEPFLLVRRVKR